jgi:hypothetical protein
MSIDLWKRWNGKNRIPFTDFPSHKTKRRENITHYRLLHLPTQLPNSERLAFGQVPADPEITKTLPKPMPMPLAGNFHRFKIIF